MAKKLMIISWLALNIIGFTGIFVNWPKLFLLIIVPVLLVVLIASFFKEAANVEKRELENFRAYINSGIDGAAEKIAEHPEVLLWR
jgi:hypothetical protein